MPFRRLKPLPAFLVVLALVAGIAALASARWAKPLLDAERFQLLQYVFAGEHAAAVYNQLALLYHGGNYDAVLEKAAAAPAGAAPHFWSGLVLLRRTLAEEDPSAQLVGFSRAEDELKQALQAAPDDWDTRYNYEIAARLAAELRRQPKRKIDEPLRLLRPQPVQGQPPRRVG
jgi:hypothetical protein